jgi:transcriptional regulator with AAA-type ATPase domain
VHWRIWEEEMRSFPFGGRGARVWIVRRDQEHVACPLRLLFAWSWQASRLKAAGMGSRLQQPPLSRLWQAILTGQSYHAAFRSPSSPAAAALAPAAKERCQEARNQAPQGGLWLWVEPLGEDRRWQGALAVIYDNTPPWGEAMRLWASRLVARLSPILAELPPGPDCAGDEGPGLLWGTQQPLLFSPGAQRQRPAGDPSLRQGALGLPLPRPVFISGIPGAVSVSQEMRDCCRGIEAVAHSGVNVLLLGESGTGKEIVARAIHLGSDRKDGPWVGQNCAALPETLFESELFGHKAGAFTGASSDKVGLLASAHGGTFFLDEIGDMPVSLQIKLLRVMQERRVRRIGELESRPVDIRFIAATHKDLAREVANGRFRLDLFYRLKVVQLAIPPLRRRPEDIAHLLAYFLRRYGEGRAPGRITERALATLQAYRWPGNVRELENEVCRLLALYPQLSVIDLDQLSADLRAAAGWSVDPSDLATLRPLGEATQLLERYLIRKAVAAAGGRKAAAARRLGLSRQGLYKKIQRYGMSDLIQTS